MHPILGAFLLAGAITASTPTALSARPATPDVSVAIAPNADGTSYNLQVFNTSGRAITTVVTQSLPSDVTSVRTTEGGKLSDGIVTWRPTLPPHSIVRLTTTLATPSAFARQVSSVCAADPATGRLRACASAVTGREALDSGTPWWRSPYLLLLPGLSIMGWALWRYRDQRPRGHHAEPRRDLRRLAPLASVVAVLAVAAGALIFAKPFIRYGLAGRAYLGQAGWYGEQHRALLGAPATDEAVEFTVHRLLCTSGSTMDCAVVAEFRNISPTKQAWYLGMQRLYTNESQWFQPDAEATIAANGGVNVFATPLAPGKPVLATLRFSLPQDVRPVRLELREGPAARGVFLTL